MALTFKEIVDAVLADGFAEAKRSSAKEWVRFRHAWLWRLEQWTFRYGTATVTFTASSQTAGSLPTDFHAAIGLYTSTGSPVTPIKDPAEFFDLYNTNLSTTTGTPEAFTVFGSSILVGPSGDGSTGLLLYEKKQPTLTADSDSTGLPDGFDLALVHGGKAEGFKLANVPLWQGFDEDFTAAANALRRDFLTNLRAGGQQLGAYHPGQWT